MNETADFKLEDDLLLTPAQVADRLSVSLAWVRDHSTRRKPYLPVIRIGGLRRYPKREFERFIGEQKSLSKRTASVKW